MSKLAEKMRKAREVRIEVREHVFVALRPTDLDMLEFRDGITPRTLLRFVIGWEKVRELDLLPGGDPHPLDFDAEAMVEWAADDPEIFSALVNGITGAYAEHQQKRADAKKN